MGGLAGRREDRPTPSGGPPRGPSWRDPGVGRIPHPGGAILGGASPGGASGGAHPASRGEHPGGGRGGHIPQHIRHPGIPRSASRGEHPGERIQHLEGHVPHPKGPVQRGASRGAHPGIPRGASRSTSRIPRSRSASLGAHPRSQGGGCPPTSSSAPARRGPEAATAGRASRLQHERGDPARPVFKRRGVSHRGAGRARGGRGGRGWRGGPRGFKGRASLSPARLGRLGPREGPCPESGAPLCVLQALYSK